MARLGRIDMSDKGREFLYKVLKDAIKEPDELLSKLSMFENYLCQNGWHHEDDLDKCRHFNLTENHEGRLKCCYIGAPACEIRGQVCAMVISINGGK